MFTEPRDEPTFDWMDLGDISLGRPNLGDQTSVAVYRLMQFTLRDILITEVGPEKAAKIFYRSGQQAGIAFCKNVLNTDEDFNTFVSSLQIVLKDLGVGIMRMEMADLEALRFSLTVEEDLDCSGLPSSDEMVCDYDEGFIAGVFSTYLSKDVRAEEVDCWASGGRVCRFEVTAH